MRRWHERRKRSWAGAVMDDSRIKPERRRSGSIRVTTKPVRRVRGTTPMQAARKRRDLALGVNGRTPEDSL